MVLQISALTSNSLRFNYSACSLRLFRKRFSTVTSRPESPTLEYTLSHPIYTIWGSNTGVGKTLVSTGLAASVVLSNSSPHFPTKFIYLKPVQTGFPADSDSRYVFGKVSQLFHCRSPLFSVLASNHVISSSVAAANAVPCCMDTHRDFECPNMMNLGLYEEEKLLGGDESQKMPVSELICKTLFCWREAVSPHLAAEREGGVVEDSVVIQTLQRCLGTDLYDSCSTKKDGVWTVVETAGGVASPGPSGSLQCDLYRPFRLPAILVGDGRLGGISGTISSYESLNIRGYDVAAIVFEDYGLMNELPLLSYLKNRVPVLVLPRFPYDLSDDMIEWFDSSRDIFTSLKDIMLSTYLKRIERFHSMPKKAGEFFWWPFTQHQLVAEENVTVIDSRSGENFSVYKHQSSDTIIQQFDACASWWTQGPDAALQIELARNMGYAAARYGHVMFPENVYEPALECAELLLEGVGKGWASRVFFSDNGSTAVEIALKMAFRKFCVDRRIILDATNADVIGSNIELKVLALKGCYHGDTLGAMEAQSPSSFTGFLQQPWYTGRGIFLDPPTVFLCGSKWKLSLSDWLHDEKLKPEDLTFSSRDDIFAKSRDYSVLAARYSSYILQHLILYSGLEGSAHIGSLIIEPVILGSGGMHMVDPLFQRLLVCECQSRKIPVIFDEVFTGFWRLGTESAAQLLGCQPDIACYGKLLTGGIIPLAVTLAAHPVFESFIGESKLWALLHGHSYTANAMGCVASAQSIKWFNNPHTNRNLIVTSERRQLKELWDADIVLKISSNPAVQRVVVLGTLFAIELRVEGHNAGYAGLYGKRVVEKLGKDGVYMRPLGNVIYAMCGPCTSPRVCTQIALKIHKTLHQLQLSENPAFRSS